MNTGKLILEISPPLDITYFDGNHTEDVRLNTTEVDAVFDLIRLGYRLRFYEKHAADTLVDKDVFELPAGHTRAAIALIEFQRVYRVEVKCVLPLYGADSMGSPPASHEARH